MCSKASPVSLVCDVMLPKYVFSCLKAVTFLFHSHVVTGKMENILRHSVILGYIVWSISFKAVKFCRQNVSMTLSISGNWQKRINKNKFQNYFRHSTYCLLLSKIYTFLFFFCMKILTDFREMVETGMDPRP